MRITINGHAAFLMEGHLAGLFPSVVVEYPYKNHWMEHNGTEYFLPERYTKAETSAVEIAVEKGKTQAFVEALMQSKETTFAFEGVAFSSALLQVEVADRDFSAYDILQLTFERKPTAPSFVSSPPTVCYERKVKIGGQSLGEFGFALQGESYTPLSFVWKDAKSPHFTTEEKTFSIAAINVEKDLATSTRAFFSLQEALLTTPVELFIKGEELQALCLSYKADKIVWTPQKIFLSISAKFVLLEP